MNEEKPEEQKQTTPENGNGETPPSLVTIPAEELNQLQKELDSYRDKYFRALAEMENMRKRLIKEKHELIQQSAQNIIAEFLNPIDHMENALKFTQQMSDDVKHWALGFQMILNQFKDVLQQHGVMPFPAVGTAFDPHRHEAIEMVDTQDYPPGTIVEESLRGYKMGDKIIRVARVKVAKAPEQSSNETESEQKNSNI